MKDSDSDVAATLTDWQVGDWKILARSHEEFVAKVRAGILELPGQCIAEGKTGSGKSINGPQTHRCQKEAGHEGAHEAKYEFRTVSWYGPAVKQEDDTRFRWGLR